MNHRLLLKDGFVEIIECYYDDAGKPTGYCDAAVVVDAEDSTEDGIGPAKHIRMQLRQMLKATIMPILTMDDFTVHPLDAGAE